VNPLEKNKKKIPYLCLRTSVPVVPVTGTNIKRIEYDFEKKTRLPTVPVPALPAADVPGPYPRYRWQITSCGARALIYFLEIKYPIHLFVSSAAVCRATVSYSEVFHWLMGPALRCSFLTLPMGNLCQ
jgi:hypothetical protein